MHIYVMCSHRLRILFFFLLNGGNTQCIASLPIFIPRGKPALGLGNAGRPHSAVWRTLSLLPPDTRQVCRRRRTPSGERAASGQQASKVILGQTNMPRGRGKQKAQDSQTRVSSQRVPSGCRGPVTLLNKHVLEKVPLAAGRRGGHRVTSAGTVQEYE